VSAIGEGVQVVDVDSRGVVISETGRLVALVGVDDLVVVDTEDALLVTSRAHAQEVKAAVRDVERTGRGDLL
jgi:mannose-1-phosphate guanylyltransferase